MEKLTYKLDAFEGPLDLLLYLIRKNKLNICDIPITEVLQQYMDHIHAAQEENMDVSSAFLEMAARLVYIKTVYLLPKHEEADTMRAELSGQLLEYEECKRVAALLGGEISTGSTFARAPAQVEPDMLYRRPINPVALQKAYCDAAGKRTPPPTQQSFSKLVTHRVVSVASQIISVLRHLWHEKRVPFKQLFAKKRDRSEIVATFLAVLELVRGKRVRVEGDGDNPTVKLVKAGEHK
ncbi:MAG: segregation/condensation protein A [Oscillospiraceae bacterium]|jgi:segregation and condensation protein A|nr:segregation/condensation protein A [Oscillospiraceae bacterium]